jgi:hypothetical protein
LDFGFDEVYPASTKLASALVLAGQVRVWLGSALHRLAFCGIISTHAAAPTKSRMTELPQIKQPNLKQPMPDRAKAVSETKPKPILQPQCPSCGRPENIVWVHGHGQCAHCRMNVMPCCDGETCAAS